MSYQTYLDDEVLQCLSVLVSLRSVLALQAIDGEDFEVVDALVALLHLLKSRLIVAARNHLAMLDLLVAHHFLVALVQLGKLLLIDALAFTLTFTLTEHLDLKGFLVRILSHHAL